MKTIQEVEQKMIHDHQQDMWRKTKAIKDKYLSLMHWELGKLWGIPECCIKQFVEENNDEIMSAIHRQNKHQKLILSVDYVPCDKCMKNL